MPFCVNCGAPVNRGDTTCGSCKNSPWTLSDSGLVELDRNLSNVIPEQPSTGDGASSASAASVLVLVAAICLLFGATVWQLGVFNVGQGNMVTTGFVKMQPLTPSIYYRGSGYSASFTNALGTTIQIDDISVTESISGMSCNVDSMRGTSVRAGGTYTVRGNCDNKYDGDAYDLIFTIKYTAVMGGISATHTDVGHVKGQAEAGDIAQDNMPGAATGEAKSVALAQSAPFHVYKAFNFGAFLPVVALLGTALLIYFWSRLQKMIKDGSSVKVLAVAMSGMVFIILSLFIFMFGFHDLVTHTGGNTWIKPTFTQQYAWIIETIVFGSLGYILIALAERLNTGAKEGEPIFRFVSTPLFYVFYFAAAVIYLFGVTNFVYSADYANYRVNTGWAIETFVFGVIALFFSGRVASMQKEEERRSLLPTPLRLTGAGFIALGILVYVFGAGSTFWNDLAGKDWRWLLESAALLVPAALFIKKAEGILKEQGGKDSILPGYVFPVSGLLILSAALEYLIAVHMSLYTRSAIGSLWIVGLLAYLIPGVLLLRYAIGASLLEDKGIRAYLSRPMSYVFLGAAILVYMFGLHSSIWAAEGKGDYAWLAEFLAYIAPAIALVWISCGDVKNWGAKKGDIISSYVQYISTGLMIVAAFGYALGTAAVFGSSLIKWDNFLKIVLECAFFAFPAVAMLMYYDGNVKKKKEKALTPGFFEAAGSVLFLAFMLVYAAGILEALKPFDVVNTYLIIEALAYLAPGLYLLRKAEKLKEKENETKPLLKQYYKLTGGIFFVGAAYFTFVLGMHGVFSTDPLRSDEFIAKLAEILVLGVPAAVFLLAAERRRAAGEKSVLPTVFLPAAYLFLGAFLFVYLPGVLFISSGEKYKWIFEALIYVIPGAFFLYASNAIRKTEGEIRSLMTLPLYLTSMIILAEAVMIYIFGMHAVFSSDPFSSGDFLSRLWQIILLGVPAGAFFYLAEKQLGKEDKSMFPRMFQPVSYVMLCAFLVVYLFGVQEAFSGSGYRDVWAFEALVYFIPGAFFLYVSGEIRKKQGEKVSVMSKPLYSMGVVYIAATLISFVFGFNDFLYSDKQNLDWLVKTIAYLVPAALSLYLAEKLK